ncbi:MAG: helix-turn-helix domain-containing protein [Actinomycetales bacterium]|nr:helix-turn-helix domain-containing protein [Actinomycetales bacterium]
MLGFVPLTPDQIRVLAHPLRARLVERLRTRGPATATKLAHEFDTNSGATSYHLRRLEVYGLVQPAGGGRGRERRWEASARRQAAGHEGGQGARARSAENDPDTESSLDWLDRDYIRHFAEKAEQWLDAAPEWPEGWTVPAGLRDGMVLVTQAQLADLRAELDGVLARYRRVGQGNPKARRVAVYTSCQPIDLEKPPRG